MGSVYALRPYGMAWQLTTEQRLLIQHTISVIIIEAGLGAVRWLAQVTVSEGLRDYFVWADEFVMFVVFLLGAWNLVATLWNNRERLHVFVLP